MIKGFLILLGIALFVGAFYVLWKGSGSSRDLDSQRDFRRSRGVRSTEDYWDDIKPK